MTDLAPHKARIDAAQTLRELARIEADVHATSKVEHWPADAWREFDLHRYGKAVELARKSGAGTL